MFLPTEHCNYYATTCDCYKDRWQCKNLAAVGSHTRLWCYLLWTWLNIHCRKVVELCQEFVAILWAWREVFESVMFGFRFLFMCKMVYLFLIILFLTVVWKMSSNGSNDSLFGSQGSTRNFTSLLNPSYLQSSNGKESHKRETEGKCFNMVTYFHKYLFWLLFWFRTGYLSWWGQRLGWMFLLVLLTLNGNAAV